MRSTESWLEARAFLPSVLRLCFALPSSLGCLTETTAAKLFPRNFKWSVQIDNNLAHQHYQRDLLLLEYAASRG